jgi:hypothetical protein
MYNNIILMLMSFSSGAARSCIQYREGDIRPHEGGGIRPRLALRECWRNQHGELGEGGKTNVILQTRN